MDFINHPGPKDRKRSEGKIKIEGSTTAAIQAKNQQQIFEMLQQQHGRSKSSQSMVPAVASTFGSQGSKGAENISKAINVYSSTSNAPT